MDFKCEINEVKTLSNGDTVEILEYSFIPAKSMGKLSSSQLRLKLNLSGRIFFFEMVNQPSGGFSLIQAVDADGNVVYKSVKWSIHDLCKVIGAQIHYNDEEIEELIRLVIRIRRYLMDNIKECQSANNCDLKVWWVNQGDSQKAEKTEEILWAPQKSADGKSLYHWDTMTELQKDDIVLNYSNGALRYVSRVISQAVESQQPEALKNAYYGRDGNLVKLEYHELIPEININTIMDALKNSNIEQGPFNANGGVKQGYLFRFTIAAMQLIKQAQPETSWPAFTDVEDVTPMQNYWIFQGNPKVFKVVDGLRDNAIKTWYVAAHKQKIKEGDKVIIWVTGAQAGCYALAKVTSGVHMVHEESPEYSVDPTEESTGYEGCEIEIEYLLADCPILKTEIAGNEELADLNVGYQGTNFTATKDQYLELERMAKEHLANAEGAPKFELNKTYTLEHLCKDTGFEPAEASQWIRSIQRKGQAILYGPPGTGKTFVAEYLAKLLLSEGDGCSDLVQFHPA